VSPATEEMALKWNMMHISFVPWWYDTFQYTVHAVYNSCIDLSTGFGSNWWHQGIS